jgi:hypothetical protein
MNSQTIEDKLLNALKCLNIEDILSLQKLIRYPLPIHQEEVRGLCSNDNNCGAKIIQTKSTELYELEISEIDKITKGSPAEISYNIVLTSSNSPLNSLRMSGISQSTLTKMLIKLKDNPKEIKPNVSSRPSSDFLTIY